MSLNFYKQVKNYIALVVMILFSTTLLYAQPMSGTFTIDPAGSGATNFTTFKEAIDSLNSKGVGTGGVTFNVAAGATFAETGTLILRATGTASNPIVFQKSGVGANPIVNPAFGSVATTSSTFDYGTAGDAILRIVGTDFLTIDGINFVEPVGRSSVALTEYGIAILRASATDGSKNINIRNCTISLNRATNLSVGILVTNRTETFTAVTVTSAVGRNENIVIQNNNINNVYEGVYLYGQSIIAVPYDLYDHFITVRNNSITNFGGAGNTTYGIYGIYLDSIRVANNTISGGAGQTTTYYGIFLSSGTGSTVNIDSNNVEISGWAGTTGTMFGISNSMGAAIAGLSNVVNIRNNTVSLASTTITSGTATGLTNSAGGFTVNITNNTIRNFAVGATTSTSTGTCTINGILSSGSNSNPGSICNITGNTVRDITRTQQTGTTLLGAFNGISATSSALTLNITNNIVRNLTIPTGTSTINLINVSASADLRNVRNNSIDSVFTGGGTMIGINISGGTTTNVNNNLISGIYSNKASGNTVTGLNITGGTTVNAFNNIITNLRAPISTSNTAVTGISATGGTNVNVDFNTVYLNATSTGSGFGSTALNFGTSPTTLIARNNILYNASTSSGTGRTVAIRRSAANPTNYNNASNNNLIYAGIPGANNLIYLAGTTADTTLNKFKARVASADALSLTGVLSFVNTTTLPFDLHINTSTATLIESAGMTVAGITTDYDGNTRDANNPDIGADEGAFIAGADVQGPAITYTALSNTGFNTNRTIVVNISDRTGVNAGAGTSPRLYFKKTTDANTFIANANTNNGWKYVESTTTTSPFSFTIDYSLFNTVVGSTDTIQYFVIAQDAVVPSNVSVNSAILSGTVSDVNLTSANFPATGNINRYRILPQVYALVTVGSGGTYPNLSGTGGLFDAINNSSVTSNVTAQVISHLDETGAVGLQQFTEEGPGAGTYRISIVPSSAVEDSIRGSFAGGLIRLNSADRVTFDGSFAGSGKYFVFINKNTASTVANIQLVDNGGTVNGCENIIIKNSIFAGLTTTTQTNSNYGISVGGGVGATGRNHHNLTIDSNEFKGLKFGIYATGIAGSEFQNLRIRDNVIGNLDQKIRDKGIVIGYVNRARIFRNTIFGLQSISSSVSSTMAAISITAGTTNSMIDRNNIYDIAFTGTGGWDARGITVSSSSLTNNDTIYSNIISWVRNDGYNGITDGALGIAIDGGVDRLHIYNNSINMFGNYTNATFTSGPLSAGIYVGGGTNVNIKNNLTYNRLKSPNATAAPLAEAYGIYIAGTAGAGGAIASLDNNNYATDGTVQSKVAYVNAVKFNTLLDHQLATNRDKNSFAEVPAFVDSINLRINSGTVGTLLESHGQNIPGVNRDIDGQVRPGPVGSVNGGALTFDIGADEFDGVYLADIFPPTILVDSISPSVDNCRPLAHTVYARITDLSGIDTAEIRYSVNGVARSPFLMTSLGSGRYSGTIPAQVPGAQVILSIYAQDSLNNSITKGVDTFIDARFNFTTFASADTVAAGNTFQLDALLPSTVKQIGTGTGRTTFVPNPYYTGYWGSKGQFLITAAELRAQGFVAGNITSLGLNVTTLGLPMNNFTIRMASTSLTNLTSSFVSTGFTQVYTIPVLNLVANSFNNHVFQTPFYWDGVSNLLIETCFNNTQWAGAASVEFTTTTFVSNTYYFADAAGVCAVGSGTTSNNRPNFILGQPLTATYTWSSSANGGLQSTNIRNPLATPTGAAGLYSYYLTANDGKCSWTDTVDVRVVTAVTPLASFRTDTTIAVSGNTPTEVSVINSATNFPNTWKYSITPSNFQFIKGTDANSKAPKFIFNRAGTYTIKQVVTNAAGSDSLTRSNYITVTLDYCRPTVSSTFQYTHINSFKLRGLTNPSGQTTGAYNNYTDSTGFVVPQLVAGRTDTITFRLGAGTFNANNTTTAWIDFNQDGAFTNDEILGNAFGVPAINTDATIIFKAPYTAVSGQTRLRIRNSAFAAANTPLPACGSTTYGETEDYTVNIAPAPLMAVQAVKLEQDTVAVLPGTSNALVLGTKVIVTGYTNRLNTTSINVSTAGTTSLSNITGVRAYYTANNASPVLSPANLFATATPAANLTLTGNALLEGDTNYFWLVYDVDSLATIGNTIDAQITSVTIGGTPVTPLNSNPAGNKKILLQAVPTLLAGYQPFNTIPVYPNSSDNPVIAAKITMTNGVLSSIDRLTLALTNTKLGILSSARLVYTGNDSTYTTPNKVQFGSNPLSFAGNIVFADTMQLVTGDNYFWLTTDVNTSAAIGDTLDAVFSSARIQGNTVNATVTAPVGVRKVEAFPIT
ncbi:MAG: BNR-repeat neuraminidase N-terminal domain-containing protein, partial [bacterium]